ncbi:MAG: signal peptidase I [Verrucomicrobiales bacterium]|nr:signal peptidase I [Verrucomicrobiales bacterium]
MGNAEATPSPGWIRTFVVGRNPVWTLGRIAILVVSVYVVFKYVLLVRKIESTSMLPSFREGSIHWIYRLAYRGTALPARGDVVGIRTSGETVMYIKRVVGLPGETLEIRRGEVWIDGKPLEEPHVRPGRKPWNRRPRTLGPDEYFVIGDNRSMDQEQHEFGVVERARIVGKVIR